MHPHLHTALAIFALIASHSPAVAAAAVADLPAPPEDPLPFPYNLPRHLKYFPEHQNLVRRHDGIKARMATQAPLGMRKMSGDPGEMFFLDYWGFEPDADAKLSSDHAAVDQLNNISPVDGEPEQDEPTPSRARIRPRNPLSSNSTLSLPDTNALLPPFPLHFSSSPDRPLLRRSFQCPQDTSPCDGISRPNSCCGSSETCVLFNKTDTSSTGDVGCCSSGQDCSDSGLISTCDTASGYTSCPSSPNGGCCIPNFTCQDVGCVAGSTSTTTLGVVVTVTVTPGATTVNSTTTPSLAPVTTTQTILDTATLTSTSPTPQSTTTVYTTLTPATTVALVPAAGQTTCTSGFNSCPASLGGGCCPTDRACGSSDQCPPLETATQTGTTTVPAAVAPVRPTSAQDSAVTSVNGDVCPTGYYMCSAYYMGACCQVGRDCSSSSCPPHATSTVVSDGQTIVIGGGAAGGGQTAAPTGEAPNSVAAQTVTSPPDGTGVARGACAVGWSACGTAVGGGCCPGGYACGTASCQATGGQAAMSQVAKAGQQGSSAATVRRPILHMWLAGSIVVVTAVTCN